MEWIYEGKLIKAAWTGWSKNLDVYKREIYKY